MRVLTSRGRALARAAIASVAVAVPASLLAAPLGGGPGAQGYAGGARLASPAHDGSRFVGGHAYGRGAQFHSSGQRYGQGYGGGLRGRQVQPYGSYVIPPASASASFPPYVYGYGASYGYGPYGAVHGAGAGVYGGGQGRVIDGVAGSALAQGNGALPTAAPIIYRIAGGEGRSRARVVGAGAGFQGGGNDPSLPRVITVRPAY